MIKFRRINGRCDVLSVQTLYQIQCVAFRAAAVFEVVGCNVYFELHHCSFMVASRFVGAGFVREGQGNALCAGIRLPFVAAMPSEAAGGLQTAFCLYPLNTGTSSIWLNTCAAMLTMPKRKTQTISHKPP